MENNVENWKLKKLEIELQTYGDFKGKYKGRISFENGEYENFTFNLTDEQMNDYIKLLSPQIVKNASELGNKLIESLGLKENEENTRS